MAWREPLLSVEEGPAAMPVTLAEARAACRIDADDMFEDGYLTILIAAAAELLDGYDGYLGQAIIGQTWLALYWPGSGPIDLPLGPVSAVDSIGYLDPVGVEQVLDLSALRISRTKWRCLLTPPGAGWPAMASREDALRVRFTAGGEAAPAPVKLAVLTIVAFWFKKRDGGIADGVPDHIWTAVGLLLANERRF